MPWKTEVFRVRRLSQRKFRVVRPCGDYELTEKGNPKQWSSYQSAKNYADRLNTKDEVGSINLVTHYKGE